MQKRTTIEDVAEAAGVSRQTVSRAINDKGEISPDTKARVMQAVADLGYRPNRLAQGMVTQRTRTVGLVLADITNPFFPEVARGVQDVAREYDYNVFLGNTDDDGDVEMQVLNSLAAQGVDGIILFSRQAPAAALSRFATTYRPLLMVNQNVADPQGNSVQVDNKRGARLAVDYLIAKGHRHIGMIGPDSPLREEALRVQGYREALSAAGLPVDSDWLIPAETTLDGGYDGLMRLLTQSPEITAIFAYNDMQALGAIRACHDLGRRVPDDCAIIGFDDIGMAAMFQPALSSVRVDKYELGRRAMHRLLTLIDAPNEKFPPILLEVELVLRESA